MASHQHVVKKSSSNRKGHWVSGTLLSIMILGFVVIASVFLSNRQALPISIGEVNIDAKTSANALPLITDIIGNDPIVVPEANHAANNTELETGSVQDVTIENDTVEIASSNPVVLTVISTERADEIIPPQALNYDPANRIDVPTSELEIPNPEMPITVFLAGTTGCSTCAIEAQSLRQIVHELENPKLQIIVVDIYPYGGAEGLAWFAGIIDATDLTWAMDQGNTFMNTYQVALDSTLIMDRTGAILYRDDVITSYEALREQIERALNQST